MAESYSLVPEHGISLTMADPTALAGAFGLCIDPEATV